jgi:hypothetical protein
MKLQDVLLLVGFPTGLVFRSLATPAAYAQTLTNHCSFTDFPMERSRNKMAEQPNNNCLVHDSVNNSATALFLSSS